MTRTVFRGGRVWDGRSDTAADADVVVEDGVIVKVGPGLDGDEAVDCAGGTLVPGFIDCHVHVVLSTLDMLRQLRTRPSYRLFESARNLRLTLEAGVTTIRDAGGADAGVRDAVRDGLVVGPRMRVAITIMSQTGGHADGFMPCGLDTALFLGDNVPSSVADGVDGVRRRTREILRAGADVIKVCTSGGVLSPDDDPKHAQYQPDELAAIVAEADAVGRPVMAHAQSTAGIKNALYAGMRSIEHGIYLDDEAVQLMLNRGTFLVPTLIAPHSVVNAAAAGAAIPIEAVQKARTVIVDHEASFKLAVEAGVRIAMGTDAGVGPHGGNLDEIVAMHRLGLAPAACLRAATHSAAELLGLQDVVGSVEPGKRADLVLIDGDALDIPGLPGRVRGVWQDGQSRLSPALEH